MPDRLIRGLVAGGAARFVAVDVTEAAQMTQELHQLNAGAARLAGECLVAATLMSAYIKGEERISLQLQAENPAASFLADVDSEGFIRARLRPQRIQFDGLIEGIFVVMNSNLEREIYRGSTEVRGQSIENALHNHLHDSNQVEAAIRLGAKDDGFKLTFAGGLLVERLPAEEDPAVNEAFHGRFGKLLECSVDEVVGGVFRNQLLGRTAHSLVERPLSWRCRCSSARVEAIVGSLGPTDLGEMIADGQPAEVTCHFCNTTYLVEVARMEEMKALYEQA